VRDFRAEAERIIALEQKNFVADRQFDLTFMAISVHPFLTGVPHRIGYLEKLYDYILSHEGVVAWTGEQILDWYLAETLR
jgi:hypothetical protein